MGCICLKIGVDFQYRSLKIPYFSISGQMLKLASTKGQDKAEGRIVEWASSLWPHFTVLHNNHTSRL